MHVLLITQYFPPEIGAAASRWGDYVDIFIDKGYKITVLCEMPNYPYGNIFDGYKGNFVKKEKLSNNLTIIRSGVWANNRKSKFKLLGNYLSFVLIGIFNVLKIKNYDLIIISSPPLFVGIIGIILKKIKKCSILLDIRDIWPESAFALGQIKSNWILMLGRWLELSIYKSVNGFIFSVPGFYNYFKKNFPDQLKKPTFNLMNGIDKKFLQISKKHNSPEKHFTVLYSGNMGLAQGLEVIVNTAESLTEYPINFRFIGDGIKKESLINLANSKNISNITFEDPLTRNELIKEMLKASVCLVPLIDNKLFRTAIPSKIFEIMACSKPVILGVKGDAEKIIKQNECGIVVTPDDQKDYKKAILKYYNDRNLVKRHGENSVNYVTENMQKDLLLSTFLTELKDKESLLKINIL